MRGRSPHTHSQIPSTSTAMVVKVAICGGGIGGLTTALSIDRLCGHQVELDVYEQASQYKVVHAANPADGRKSVPE